MKLGRRAFLYGCAATTAGLWLARRSHALEANHGLGDARAWALDSMPVEDGAALDLFALGDIGMNTPERAEVVSRMLLTRAEAKPALAALLGDNFYHSGIESTSDPRWLQDFELCFPERELDVPFLAVLGNHDHEGNIRAQIEYSKLSTRWTMPAQRYELEREIGPGGSRAAFFCLDTTPFRSGWNGGGEQTEWLAQALRRSAAHWKIVIGHHPILSHGQHGGTPDVASKLAGLFERYGVQLYLSGHDHDQQLVRARTGWCQIVSGAGSATRAFGRGPGTLFASSDPGFAWLRLTQDAALVQFLSGRAGPIGTYRIERSALAG